MNPYLLLFIGFLLIFLEFYLPGAVLGVLGGILVFISLFVYAEQSTSLFATLAFIIGALVALGALIRFALWRIPRTKPAYSIYSDDAQEGYVASHFDESAIGKTGVVLSDLKPGGYILIEGKQHQAISQEGYIAKGEHVLVLYGQEESLIVKKIKKEAHS